MRVTNPNDLKALSKGLEGMTSDLEEEIKRLPAGTAMLVSNEIERPITVGIRPRKSRHGGTSTTIVSKDGPSSAKDKGSKSEPPVKISRSKEKAGGSLLRKVFSKRA
jgi:hypothetical protein